MEKRKAISRADVYMLIAEAIAQRSKDPRTQVGAAIVSKNDRILSLGYNGFPNGCSDDEFPWAHEAESEYDTKYPYVCHAELNAILNFKGNNNDFNGATLYVTLFPCHECVKAIIQVGISRIYYERDRYPNSLDSCEARRMLDAAGIEYIRYASGFGIFQK